MYRTHHHDFPLCSLPKYATSFSPFHHKPHTTSPLRPSYPNALTPPPLPPPIITRIDPPYLRIQPIYPPSGPHSTNRRNHLLPSKKNPQSATRCPSSVLAKAGTNELLGCRVLTRGKGMDEEVDARSLTNLHQSRLISSHTLGFARDHKPMQMVLDGGQAWLVPVEVEGQWCLYWSVCMERWGLIGWWYDDMSGICLHSRQ